MTVGFVMLCHEALDRAAQVAGHLAGRGCPVVIHVDRRVSDDDYDGLVVALADHANILFSRRYRCEWGTWSLVAATQSAAELMLERFAEVGHVFLGSGTCLPLRPVDELRDFLAANRDRDFIESVTTEDVPWTQGGLDYERFILRFPVSWRRHRRLFDRVVAMQRRLGYRRRIPDGIDPHMGSQWWCLTRTTLAAILTHPRRAEFDRYFRQVWIPDESYFQTLARLTAKRIESRSLTLAKFDVQGKPHVFYDDHLPLLRRSDCFVARKIWPRAERLYRAFLVDQRSDRNHAEPSPAKIDRVFARAGDRRARGRPGLYMAGRFPRSHPETGLTAARYAVFEGLGALFDDFPDWVSRVTGLRAHGHLFAPERAEFAGGETTFVGALSDNPVLRDYNPVAFLTNLIWNTRGERQAFLYGPRDGTEVGKFFAFDPNADVFVVRGAWAIPLFRSDRPFAERRSEAARLQRIEAAHLADLRSGWTRARVHIWSMADFVEAPGETLRAILDEIGSRSPGAPVEMPHLVDLRGFGEYLQRLKNDGMNPYLVGEVPVGDVVVQPHRIPGHQSRATR